MDYKIAGSDKGITAIQLDLKVKGVPLKILAEGIDQAKEARNQILNNMTSVIAKPRTELSQFAPRIVKTQVPVEKIGEIIGPGGKTIKKIIEQTGVASVDIDDEGTVLISAIDPVSAQKALDYVNGLVQEPEVGKIYDAVVAKVTNFGAFCEYMPGKQGLVHVSEFSDEYVKDMTTVCNVGDKFKVKLVEIDQMKRANLSKKKAEATSKEPNKSRR
jgi:polyribonucleotide nucleotidyltransferase